ncbi:ATP-binding cassette domain-containing protein [Micromonospora sp. KC207]|uniref:ATP-binding cassette domain-containing protein n=1 Tax=Micromonospora sp. KC207 TaxID=2530377 RepID=UPI0014056020|nr:ATP-binding cassette domain-containing protein [Micromonospora sp. KC207]
MDTTFAIETSGLRKSYGDVRGLQGVDLRVERGTMLALLGPNGAGKTTLIRILTTLLNPDDGVAMIEGHQVVRDAARVREVIGLTSQDASIDGVLTGRENLVMMGRLFHLGRSAARQRAAELLSEFDLVEAAERQVRYYSGGMRRRLDLAVSLVTAPPVLLLDEPTTGLDPRSRQALWETIKKLLAAGTTILLTTQNLEEADQLADRITLIDEGRIVAEGTADELKRQVGTERLELGFATERDAQRAQDVIGGVRLAGTSISIPVEDAGEVRRLLNKVGDAGLDVQGLAMRRPTLDDVFLTLTGHNAGEVQ